MTEDNQRYIHLKSGAVYDKEVGRIVGHSGEGEYQITKANARAMVERKKEKAIRSQLRGLAAKEGLALPEDASEDEILKGALDGIEALTAHMKNVFLKSENIRGLGEAYQRLVVPMVGIQSDEADIPDWVIEQHLQKKYGPVIREMAAMASRILAEKGLIDGGEIIDADVEHKE